MASVFEFLKQLFEKPLLQLAAAAASIAVCAFIRIAPEGWPVGNNLIFFTALAIGVSACTLLLANLAVGLIRGIRWCFTWRRRRRLNRVESWVLAAASYDEDGWLDLGKVAFSGSENEYRVAGQQLVELGLLSGSGSVFWITAEGRKIQHEAYVRDEKSRQLKARQSAKK